MVDAGYRGRKVRMYHDERRIQVYYFQWRAHFSIASLCIALPLFFLPFFGTRPPFSDSIFPPFLLLTVYVSFPTKLFLSNRVNQFHDEKFLPTVFVLPDRNAYNINYPFTRLIDTSRKKFTRFLLDFVYDFCSYPESILKFLK